MLEIHLCGCGVNTEHLPDTYFEDSAGSNDWLLMCFHMPFFYRINGANGEVYDGSAGDCLLHPPKTYTTAKA